MKTIRSAISAILSLVMVVPPAFADTTYLFRYKTGYVNYTSNQPPIDENDYDITASFIAFIGTPFANRIPLKPGKIATSWSIISGSLPSGLSINQGTGQIEGIATGRGTSRAVLHGYSPDGADISKVNIDFSVFEADPTTSEVNVAAHSNRYFQSQLAPSGQVYSWDPVVPLPSWARLNGATVEGTPPAELEGVFSYALQGKDYTGAKSKLVYGTITVSNGPIVAAVEDRYFEPKQNIAISTRATNVLGTLQWGLEGDPLPSGLSFTASAGRIGGQVSTFGTSSRVRFIAYDSDGTVGYSNYFNLISRDPNLDIRNVEDRTLYVGVSSSFSLVASEVTGTASWQLSSGTLPAGITLDQTAGIISGIPTETGVAENLTISVSTSNGDTATSNSFKITVAEKPIKVSVARTHVRENKLFTTPNPQVTDGVAPYVYKLASGQVLPAGVTLDANAGTLSGQISESGNKTISLTVQDANGTISSPFQVGINVYGPLAITVSPDENIVTRLQTEVGIRADYAKDTIIESDGDRSATFSLSGTLPEGLVFNSKVGVITGIANTLGFYGPLAISITDASGDSARSNDFSIRVQDKEPLSVEILRTSFAQYTTVQTNLAKAISAANPVKWTLKAGTLPNGLTFNAEGVISGIPREQGIYSGIVLEVTDAENATATTEAFDINITPPEDIEIVTSTFEWPVNKEFISKIQIRNHAAPVQFTAKSGLPVGVSLTNEGNLRGVVNTPMTSAAIINVRDNMGRTAEKRITLIFTNAMTISLNPTYNLSRMSSTSITPVITDPIGTVTYTLIGELPDGLLFNNTNGEIYGKPTTEGEERTVTVRANDSSGTQASATTVLTVGVRKSVSLAYNFSEALKVNSGIGLPKFPVEPTNIVGDGIFSIVGTLPSGMAFDVTNGSFTGIPTSTGTYPNIIVSVRDSEGQTGNSGNITITVTSAENLSVANFSSNGRINTWVETDAPVVNGAVGNLTFASNPPRPLGLDLVTSTGVFQGSPTSEGSTVVNMQVTDNTGREATYRMTIKIVGPLNISYAISEPINQYASKTFNPIVENAIGSVGFTLNGNIPAGMNFDPSTGRIFGTPTTVNDYTFSVRAVDEGVANNTHTTSQMTLSVINRLDLEIVTEEEQNLIANSNYVQTARTNNAVGAVTWDLQGQLPSGVTFSPSTGKFTGIPTELGMFPTTLTATDSAGGNVSKDINFSVTTNGLPIHLTTYNVQAKVGVPFVSEIPLVKNNVGEYSFYTDELTGLGITLDPVTGIITGQFNEPASVTGNIHVTDSTNRVTSKPIKVEVMPNMRLTIREQVNVTASIAMAAVRPLVEYSVGKIDYNLIGPALPSGITFSKVTGTLTGTPTVLGTFPGYFIEATDSLGDKQTSNQFTITVYASGVLPTITVQNSYTWSASSNAYTITPTVNAKKEGDVYSINQPLPGTLTINPSTGVITGHVSNENIGLYSGYLISLTDTQGNESVSNDFDIKISSNPAPVFTIANTNVRRGVPFQSPAASLTTGATSGGLKFAGNNFPKYLTMDPGTGIVSGTFPSNYSGNTTYSPYFSVTDDVRTYGSNLATFTVVKLTASLTPNSFSVDAGNTITSERPVVNDAVGPVKFAWRAGSEVEGINVDPVTGVISGTVPVGVFSARAIEVKDDIETATFNVAITGRNPIAVFSFADQDVIEAASNSVHTTTPVQVNGILAETDFVVRGKLLAYRICTSANCSDAQWSAVSNSDRTVKIKPQQYIQLQKTASSGSGIKEDVIIAMTGMSERWSITTRKSSFVVNAVEFENNLNVEPTTVIMSNVVELSGYLDKARINFDTSGTASNPQYIICSTENECLNPNESDWKTANQNIHIQNIDPDQFMRLRVVSGTYGAAFTIHTKSYSTTTGSYNNRFGTWEVKVRNRSTTPNPVDFGPNVAAAPSDYVMSNIVELTGFIDPVRFRGRDAGNSPNPNTRQYRICDTREECELNNEIGWQLGSSTTAFLEAGKFMVLKIPAGATVGNSVTLNMQYDATGVGAGSWQPLASFTVNTRPRN